MDTPRAVVLGLVAGGVALALRLAVSAEVGGEQAIFAYPAIILATLLVGARAGVVAALVCLSALWYYVIPVKHSFVIADARGAVALAVSALVGGTLIWAISAMRRALFRYRLLNAQLEDRVEERTAERDRFWDLSRELVAIVDARGQLVRANRSLRSLISAPEDARPFAELIAAQDRHVYAEATAALDGSPGGVTFDARLGHGEGIRHIAWSMVTDGIHTFLVGRDFTTEFHCEEQLRQSQKMELVGQIAGGIAHDFGNVLSGVNIALHLARSHGLGDPRLVELVDMAERSAALGEAQIRRLLSFSRPSDGGPETVQLEKLLEDIVPLLQQSVGQRRIELDIADGLPPVRVDANQLDMALLNLTINARDATSDGDVIDLCVRREGDDAVAIVVADRGRGMDHQTLSRVVEPFFTTKATGLGTGLGLAMVNSFAEGAGGHLSIDSTPGEGTSARISLPIAR